MFGAPATAGGWQSIARSASEAGFALLEVPLLDARNVAVVDILRAAREHGLDVTCSAGLTIGSDLSSPDSEVVARGEAVLERAVDAAATLGATDPYGRSVQRP